DFGAGRLGLGFNLLGRLRGRSKSHGDEQGKRAENLFEHGFLLEKVRTYNGGYLSQFSTRKSYAFVKFLHAYSQLQFFAQLPNAQTDFQLFEVVAFLFEIRACERM